jgi:hypothetical protein
LSSYRKNTGTCAQKLSCFRKKQWTFAQKQWTFLPPCRNRTTIGAYQTAKTAIIYLKTPHRALIPRIFSLFPLDKFGRVEAFLYFCSVLQQHYTTTLQSFTS